MQIDEASWIALEPETGETLRAALRRTLRDAIRAGALREGVRLPASRTLAHHLGVSRGVVSDAYAQLVAEGFLITKQRSAPWSPPSSVRTPVGARSSRRHLHHATTSPRPRLT